MGNRRPWPASLLDKEDWWFLFRSSFGIASIILFYDIMIAQYLWRIQDEGGLALTIKIVVLIAFTLCASYPEFKRKSY